MDFMKIALSSTVAADEARHWDLLAARFPIERVDHSKEWPAEREHEPGRVLLHARPPL
jgi:hypothetical protein